MANPKVNILIANYNYDKWVVDAIDSAIAQDYPDISITIVDDCSTDSSWLKIYNRIFKSTPHNKILPSPYDIRTCSYQDGKRSIPITAVKLDKNYGPSFARNVGLSLTLHNNDFVMILDADDVMYSNKVTRCVTEAMKLPSIIGIVYADYMTENVENGLKRIEYKENFDIEKLYHKCIIHSGSLVSKNALIFAQDENGFYDNSMRVCEDYDLWMRITRKFTAFHIPECLTLVRVTPENSTNQVAYETRKACMLKIRDKFGVQV